MSDLFIDMDDAIGVFVVIQEGEEEDTFAEVADPFTRPRVPDPLVVAEARCHATDCVVILSEL